MLSLLLLLVLLLLLRTREVSSGSVSLSFGAEDVDAVGSGVAACEDAEVEVVAVVSCGWAALTERLPRRGSSLNSLLVLCLEDGSSSLPHAHTLVAIPFSARKESERRIDARHCFAGRLRPLLLLWGLDYLLSDEQSKLLIVKV